jgi:hypothetical protein
MRLQLYEQPNCEKFAAWWQEVQGETNPNLHTTELKKVHA